MLASIQNDQVVIIDRHPLFAAGLAQWLRDKLPVDVMHIDARGDTVSEVDTRLIKVMLVDMAVMELQGAAGLCRFSELHPHISLIAVCDDLPAQPRQLLAAGAMAGISKSEPPEQFLDAILTVMQGDCWLPNHLDEVPYCELSAMDDFSARLSRLSPRRQLIVERIADGHLNKQIAFELGLCESTIKAHVSAIMKHLHLRNRTQIAAVINRKRQGDRRVSTRLVKAA